MEQEQLDAQLALEEVMKTRGQERFFKSIEKGRELGFGYREGLCDRYTKMHSCPTDLAKKNYRYTGDVTFAEAIEEALKPRPGKNAKGWDLIREANLPVYDVAYIVLPILLYSAGEGRTRNTAVASIAGALEDEVNQREIRKQSINNYHILVRNTKVSSARDRRYRSKLVAEKYGYKWQEWDKRQAHQVGVALYALALSICGDAIEETNATSRTARKHKKDKILIFTGPFAKNERGCLEELALCAPASGPLLIPPQDWTTPVSGGYYGALAGKTTAVHSSLPMYKTAAHKMWDPACTHVQALNKQQHVAYRVSPQVWAVAKEISGWANSEDFKMYSGELMPRPKAPVLKNDITPEERSNAWREYMRASHEYGQEGKKENSKKVAHRRMLSVIGDYAKMDKFYYAHFLDWRGRMYVVDSCGMSFQGGPLIRGLIQFGEAKRVGKRGIDWIKVHTANCWGYDKDSFEGRIAWTDESMAALIEVAENPLDCLLWKDADSPWEFLACCFELKGISEEGEEWMSRCIVGQDGTCNGSQHMAGMVRCKDTASKVNLVHNDTPNDLYGEVARATYPHIIEDAKNVGDPQPVLEKIRAIDTLLSSGSITDAQEMDKYREERIHLVKSIAPIYLVDHLEEYVDRKLLKTNVMTSTYNVSGYGMRQQLRDVMFERCDDPKYSYINRYDVYGIAQYLHSKIEVALEEVLVATVGVMTFLKDVVRVAAKENIALQWRTPTGHWVNHSYPEYESHKITYRYLKRQIQIRMNGLKPTQSVARAVNGISANYTHSMDASHLAMTIMACDFEVCTIHDSYGSHPSDVDEMRLRLGETFCELYKGNVLQDFRDTVETQIKMQVENKEKALELIAELPSVPQLGVLSDKDIVDAGYMFS